MASGSRIVGFIIAGIGGLILLGGIGTLFYQWTWRMGSGTYNYYSGYLGDFVIASFPIGIGALVLGIGVWLTRRTKQVTLPFVDDKQSFS